MIVYANTVTHTVIWTYTWRIMFQFLIYGLPRTTYSFFFTEKNLESTSEYIYCDVDAKFVFHVAELNRIGLSSILSSVGVFWCLSCFLLAKRIDCWLNQLYLYIASFFGNWSSIAAISAAADRREGFVSVNWGNTFRFTWKTHQFSSVNNFEFYES